MKILIAEDDPVSRRVLQASLERWHHEVIVAADGEEAWRCLQAEGAPSLAILDWMMPGIDGLEICRRLRRRAVGSPFYLILLTARGQKQDLVDGFKAGADDYITKPFDPEELRVRLQAGVRIVDLQAQLSLRVRELEEALANVKQLGGLLPICAYCKKVRDDRNYWQQVESYITEHSGARFSHSICPECYARVVREVRSSPPPGEETGS
jgi:sigma-B regulation protein RsbU (phosphoserine phosphatase)